MRSKLNLALFFLIFFNFHNFALASLTQVKLNFQQVVPQSRWIYNSKEKLNPKFRNLSLIKQHLQNKKFKQCAELAFQSANQFSSIQPWVFIQASECELEFQKSLSRNNLDRIRGLIQRISAKPEHLYQGAFSKDLRNQLVELRLFLTEWEVKNRPQNAGASLGLLFDLQDSMNQKQLARTYQLAGELAFVQQRFADAKVYISKSIQTQENEELKSRLTAIESALLRVKQEKPIEVIKDIKLASTLSESEKVIVERMTLALQNGDLISAAKDGIEIIKKFPASTYSQWASDRILESYFAISQKEGDKFKSLKYDYINLIKNADHVRLLSWSQKIMSQGFYSDALILLNEANESLPKNFFHLQIQDLLAKANMYTNNSSDALDVFENIIKKANGTKESVDAYFFTGLLLYKEKKFSRAQSFFEKVLAQSQFTEHEVPSQYWLWRSAQKTDSNRAQQEVQILIEKYPFSYYGLVALSEQNKGTITFENFNKQLNIKSEFWLSPKESQAWQRVQVLLEAGWHQEASQELSDLPEPTTPDGFALIARYFASAFDYPKAIKMINQAWDQKSNLRMGPLMKIAYPKEFWPEVQKAAKEFNLNPTIVLSLLRQESSFLPRAVSTSNALGLMQIIPPTANEIAQELKIQNLVLPHSMFEPELNIRMGTYYFSKMIKEFSNNVPFGIAAYNAGPHRIKRWLSSSGTQIQNTSQHDYEIWLDLMPWSETRFYVKAIMRNFLIYQLLEFKPIQVKDPVWAAYEG